MGRKSRQTPKIEGQETGVKGGAVNDLGRAPTRVPAPTNCRQTIITHCDTAIYTDSIGAHPAAYFPWRIRPAASTRLIVAVGFISSSLTSPAPGPIRRFSGETVYGSALA